MAPRKPAGAFEIPPMRIGELAVTVIGDTALIVHAWSKKAKLEMLAKQMKVPQLGGREAKDPMQDFGESMYRLADGGYGFPSVAFKNAAVEACTSIQGVTKVAARQAFQILGEEIEIESAFRLDGLPLTARYNMVRILGSEPEMREDMVRLGGITRKADIRYRAQFLPWYTTLRLRFNRGVLAEEQIASLIDTAGFAIGVGEWRPEKKGSNGCFHVATEPDKKNIQEYERRLNELAREDAAHAQAGPAPALSLRMGAPVQGEPGAAANGGDGEGGVDRDPGRGPEPQPRSRRGRPAKGGR
jgi:hypothetical protein